MSGQAIEFLRQPSTANHLARRLIPSAEAEAFDLLIGGIGVIVSFAPKTRIFHENDPAESIYKVISGSVCTCKILSDGRRQIVAFYLPGDFIGFENADEHTLSAEALSNTKVLAIKKSALAAAASRDAAIERQVLVLMAHELARLQDRVLLLLKNASERVGEFILDMQRREALGNYVKLPMLRQDVADYLGLTIETISRTLTALESYGAIEILSRQGIAIRNRSLLKNVMADQNKMSAFWSYLRKSPADRRRTRIQDLATGPEVRSAASGHAAAEPPTSAMNSRRLIRSPHQRGRAILAAPRARESAPLAD
jgi:CRP/FNR family transcriptional regulator, nitrogen fixation regulation protein